MRRHRHRQQVLAVARRHARLLALALALRVRLEEPLWDRQLRFFQSVDVVAVEPRGRRRRHDDLLHAVLFTRFDDVDGALVVDLHVHVERVVGPDECRDVPHAVGALARLVHVVCVGEVALHPDDPRIVACVFGFWGDVEGDDALGAALDEHLDEAATDESHAAGHGTVLCSRWGGRVDVRRWRWRSGSGGWDERFVFAPWVRAGRTAPWSAKSSRARCSLELRVGRRRRRVRTRLLGPREDDRRRRWGVGDGSASPFNDQTRWRSHR